MRMSLLALTTSLIALTGSARAQEEDTTETDSPETIAQKTEGLDVREGLLTFHLDHDEGVVWLELPAPAAMTGEILACIYVESLRGGLGSNDIGLDRGQLGPSRLVVLRALGGKLLIEQQNLAFRAQTDREDERRAVRDSFATSVLWAGEIDVRDPDGRMLVDVSTFILRDAHDVAASLKRTGQGAFSLDVERSTIDTHQCLAFPDNIELEGLVTYTSSEPGRHVRGTAPDPGAFTLAVHHSFIRLPDDGYTPRRFDPRVACFPLRFRDFAAPLDASLETRWIQRHRLEKLDPVAARSPAREPIVYYVDRGAPAQIQQALIEGASWWNEAFEAAGFIDAFRVEEMPEGAHPLDVRYNVIQWVHRSTRGWSYGGAVTDPRSGEIIKGHVSLGSLRVRQDRRIFEGLAGTSKTGSGDDDDPVELALARIRQLSAHEVGHTLGFAHNFAASTYGRASVMDYPAPLVHLRGGRFDFSDSYGVGIGAWDMHCVRYAYSQFAPGISEDEALARIIGDAREAGQIFISDADARPSGAAHPKAHLWDNGENAVDELVRLINVRRHALESFGRDRVSPGETLDQLHETFVPIYLFHRYQLAATVKVLGGMEYEYNVRGADQPGTQPVAPDEQRRALEALLRTIEPEFLDIPESTLELLVPRAFGSGGNRELFTSNTSPAFDALGAASAGADLTISLILDPTRCSRLIDQHRRNSEIPSLDAVLTTLVDTAMEGGDPLRHQVIRRRVQHVLVQRLIDLAQSGAADPAVRARVNQHLRQLRGRLLASEEPRVEAHAHHLADLISGHLERPFDEPRPTESALPQPPGDPIGAGMNWLTGCSMQ